MFIFRSKTKNRVRYTSLDEFEHVADRERFSHRVSIGYYRDCYG